jgi:hypothetical protein
MTRTVVVGTSLTALVLGILAGGIAGAEQELLTKAKKAGIPAKNCQFCHVPALPKKETFKPEDLNERGKWLTAEKTKRNATEVSLDWLKDYKGQ